MNTIQPGMPETVLEVIACRECGQPDKAAYMEPTRSEMINFQLCFNCHFWTDKVKTRDLPIKVRVNGVAYSIGVEKKRFDCEFRGFGGTKFTVQFNDGRLVETTNLWCSGAIPTHFRTRLPDNAVFLYD